MPTTGVHGFWSSRSEDLLETLSRCILCGMCREDWTSWIPARDRVNKHIREKVLDSEGNLPAGTILYHGSLDPNLQFTKNRHTFFGIDAFISIWYALELRNGLCFPKRRKIGYLYEFELTKPLNQIVVLQALSDHPGYGGKTKDLPTIHPQAIYHGNFDAHELGIEVTINVKQNPECLRLLKRYIIDLDLLNANCTKTRYEFDPTTALH